MSLRFLRSLLFLILASNAAAQTVGQYELRKRTSTGFTAYGVTLTNGQVLGQTAGVPAAITPLVSGDLSAYLTSATAASTYQPLDSQLTTLAALADAAGVLKNNGGGALSYQSVSSGALAANASKIVEYASSGSIQATAFTAMSEGSVAPYTQASPTAFYFVPSFGITGTFTTTTLTTNRTWTLPDTTGILITTGDTGTVTNTMLAGSIANSKLATDPLNASNLTSGTVPTARLGSGTANSTTYLRGDNTWATVTGGVTSITGTANEITVTGTTTPTLSLPSALTFTGKTITGGTFSSPTLTTPALGTPSALVLTNATGSPTGISLTKTQLNTVVSDDDPAYLGTANTFSVAQTINTTGAGIPLNLTMSSTSAFKVTSNAAANVRVDLGIRGAYISTQNDYTTEFYSYFGHIASQNSAGVNYTGGNWALSNAADCISFREAANHWGHRNSTSAQRVSIANTYTSSTNNEFFTVDWQTTANTCRVGTVKGSGGGTARGMILQTDGTTRITISPSGEIFMVLPTSAGTTGSLWNDSGTVKVAP